MSKTNIKKNNLIYLIGYMGTGKSTLGKVLSKKMSLDFTDLDEQIVHQEKKSIIDIFADNGESYFRVLEQTNLRKLSNVSQKRVIATGGGTPCYHNNINWMLDNGIVVYLQSSSSKILQRLKNETDQRPLLRGKSTKEVHKYIEKQLKDRRPYYNRAHITVRTCNSVEQISDRIMYRIKALIS